MIAFLPHGGFLSEVSRAVGIAAALRRRGVPVVFGARGGPYAGEITAAGFECAPLAPALDGAGARRFLDALLTMGRTDDPMYEEAELRAAVASEVDFLRATGARAVVTGFTLSTYLSSRLAGVPLVTDHGGAFVPPVLSRRICPAPVNPASPGLGRLPGFVQRWMINRVPALLGRPVAQLNRLAAELGVEPVPGMLGLMCGDLTLVTELPEVLGLRAEDIEGWAPHWPFRLRGGTTFRATGPLFARLDRPIPPRIEAFLDEGPPVYLAPTSVSEERLRALVAALRPTGARVLVGATIHDVSDLEDERTRVAGVLPNHLVMPRVAAAVIMGGQGSVQTALAAGVPFVGLPYHGEQELNVGVAERLGAALRLSPDVAATPALAAAVRRLLDEPSFGEAARSVAARYADVDGADRAATAIVEWLDGRGRSAAAA